jgi:uncharacterized protein (DUF1015 family)
VRDSAHRADRCAPIALYAGSLSRTLDSLRNNTADSITSHMRETSMPVVKAFKTLRYTGAAGELQDVVAPPYDVIGPEERATLAARSEYNLVNLLLPEGLRDASVPDNRYDHARSILARWMKAGALAVESEPSMTVVEERFSVEGRDLARTGVEVALKLERFGEGTVYPHERTLSAPRADRLALFRATKTNLSPVFALVPDEDGSLRAVLAEIASRDADACVDGPDDAARRTWIERSPALIARIERALAARPAVLADGHHRYETALAYRDELTAAGVDPGEAAYMLCHIVPVEDEGLVVLPTHRVVRPKGHLDADGVLGRLKEFFDLSDVSHEGAVEFAKVAPEKGAVPEFIVAVGSPSTLVKARLRDLNAVRDLTPERADAWRELDVTCVHVLAIERVMGITAEEVASGGMVTYSHDAAESIAESAVVGGVGYIMRPTPAWAVSAVARSGERMPQKSTYFYPKVAAGFAMRLLG